MYEHYLQIVKKKHHCHKTIRLFFPNFYEVTVVIRPHQQSLLTILQKSQAHDLLVRMKH